MGRKGWHKMKRIFFLVFITALFFSGAALGQEFVITGYAPKEFALKSEPKEKLNELVQSMKKAELKAGWIWKIAIVGGADKSGSNAENDSYGKDRSEQVKEALKNAFPDAIITATSEGSALEARVVKVDFSAMPDPNFQIAKKNKSNNSEYTLMDFMILLLLVILILSIIVLVTRSEGKKEIPEIKTVKRSKTDFYSVEANGLIIAVTVKDGIHYCPFVNKFSGQIYQKSQKTMERFLREKATVPGSVFFEQVEELLTSKIISRKEDSPKP